MRRNLKTSIYDIPYSAQGFTSDRKSSQVKIKCNLYQCANCNHVQLDTDPVEYYKNVIRSVGISDEMKTYREKQFKSLQRCQSSTCFSKS